MAVGFANGSNDSKGSARARIGNFHNDYDGNGNGASHAEPKYAGTAADQRDMQQMGRVQELRVRLPIRHILRSMHLTVRRGISSS